MEFKNPRLTYSEVRRRGINELDSDQIPVFTKESIDAYKKAMEEKEKNIKLTTAN